MVSSVTPDCPSRRLVARSGHPTDGAPFVRPHLTMKRILLAGMKPKRPVLSKIDPIDLVTSKLLAYSWTRRMISDTLGV